MSFTSRLIKKALGLSNPKYIGNKGEQKVSNSLDWINFFKDKGKILRNVYVPKDNGETSEIDLLFISKVGIFVIESKNYKGYIFGNERSPKWTSTLYMGKDILGFKQVNKYHFYNPIWQNKTHIKYLRRYIKDLRIPYYSIIVFSNDAEFKNIERDEGSEAIICYRSELSSIIKYRLRHFDEVLNDNDISELYQQIIPLTNVGEELKERHILNAKMIKDNKSMICPYCKGDLVLRTAKKGNNIGKQFYGCSNYPKCRYTRDL